MFRTLVTAIKWTPKTVRNVRKQREFQKIAEIRRKEKRLQENPRPVAKEHNAVTDDDIQNFVKAVNESKQKGLQKTQADISNSNTSNISSSTSNTTTTQATA